MEADGTSLPRLRDPGRALRQAVRASDDAKIAALLEWLLKRVPLVWSEGSDVTLSTINTIRSSEGFSFDINESGVVRSIRRPEGAAGLSVGDRIVTVNGITLGTKPLREVVAPESVATLGVWKRSAMAALRSRLARETINDGFFEVAVSAPDETACRLAERLLRAHASVHCCDSDGLTPLHWAAFRGKLALCEVLVEHGALLEGVPSTGAPYTPLQLAVTAGHVDVVRTLLRSRADPFSLAAGGRQLIHLAALGPCAELVDVLLDPDPMCGARQSLDALSEHGWPALFLATAADNLVMVKALLAAGSPLGQVVRGRPLLHHAASCGAAGVLYWLGSECSAQLPLNTRDRKGRTPLLLACRSSHIGCAEVLLRLGASAEIDAELVLGDVGVSEEMRLLVGRAVDAKQRERAALLLVAASAGDVSAIVALHAGQGADLTYADERGYTALHHAAAAGREEAVLYLLQTAEGEALAATSTRHKGASADWRPQQLAQTDRIASMLHDFSIGGEERARLLFRARRRLAQHIYSARQAMAARCITDPTTQARPRSSLGSMDASAMSR